MFETLNELYPTFTPNVDNMAYPHWLAFLAFVIVIIVLIVIASAATKRTVFLLYETNQREVL